MKRYLMGKPFYYIFRIHFIILFFFIGIRSAWAQDSVTVAFPPIEDSMKSTRKDSIQYFEVVKNATVVRERKVPDSVIGKIKKDDAYWYANSSPDRRKDKSDNNSGKGFSLFKSNWFKIIIWIILIGGFTSVLVWYLASGNIHLFRKPSTVIKTENGKIIEEDIYSIDYDDAIQKAISDNQYRIAVRLLYLQLLKDLSEKKLIKFKNDSTNSDYLSQLSGSQFYKDFFRLTRSFEYAWYGKFDLSETSFNSVYRDFNSFKQQIL